MERERPRPPSARFLEEAPQADEESVAPFDPAEESSVLFADQAQGEPSEEGAALDASDGSGVRFADTAPAPEPSDAGPVVVPVDSGVHLAEVAPGASDEVRAYQEKLEAQAKQPAPKKVAIRPKVVAKRQEMITSAANEVGVAHCPACQAKNQFDATRCGRCGAEIPQAIPGGDAGRGRRYATFGEQMAASGRDPHEVVPQWQKDVFAEREAEAAARLQARRVRWSDYKNKVVVASAGLFVFIGFMTTVISFGSVGAAFVGFFFDAFVGAVAGARLAAARGGTVRGLGYFGLAGVASLGLKLALGGLGLLTSSMAGAFSLPFFVANLAGALATGMLAGTAIENQAIDDC